MTLKQIFESIDRDILSEDTLNQIEEAFEGAVENRTSERVQLAVENALIEQDEDHASKLDRFVKAIDVDHTKKLNRVVKALDENRIGKLKTVIRKYENDLNKKASFEMETLTDQISNYLERYLDDSIPREAIMEAAKNVRAQRLMDEAREVLAVDEKFAKEKIREAVTDGARQLSHLREENDKLRRIASSKKSSELLETLTHAMPVSKANFIKKRLSDKSPKFIKENFKYVADLWKTKQEQDSRSTMLSGNRSKSLIVDHQSLAGDELVKEQNIVDGNDPMDYYIANMTR